MHPFILLFSTFSMIFFAEVANTLNEFSIDLIHRDSPQSPFYNPSFTPSQLITNAALRSISHYSSKLDFSLDKNESSYETIMVTDRGEYLMRFYIGTPPIERLAIFDTGNDLIWVQCSPCKSCFPQDAPLFDPSQSSTYELVPCDSQVCTLFPQNQHDCGDSHECIYLKQYGEKSLSVGKLGSDSISFVASNSNNSVGPSQGVTFPKSIFGCGVYNNFSFEISTKASGIMGLGPGPFSLISQLGNQIGRKFSYCLLPFGSTSTSKLTFGSQQALQNGAVSTPLIIQSTSSSSYYFLNLESITVGSKTVQVGQSQTNGNIVIATAAMLTHLEQSVYNNFIASVKESIGVEVAQDAPTPFDFCLRGGGTNMTFPDLVFHFTGADVVLKPKNFFMQLENGLVCMAIVPANGISVLGNWAQVDFLVQYDLEGQKISFAPTDCASN